MQSKVLRKSIYSAFRNKGFNQSKSPRIARIKQFLELFFQKVNQKSTPFERQKTILAINEKFSQSNCFRNQKSEMVLVRKGSSNQKVLSAIKRFRQSNVSRGAREPVRINEKFSESPARVFHCILKGNASSGSVSWN